MNSNKQKYLTLLKTLYDPKAGHAEHAAVRKAFTELTETQQVEFGEVQHKVGEIFLTIREELDQGLEDLADSFPDETDPRKWDAGDWEKFFYAVEGHKFEELYTTYAKQESNLHLMWEEIERRLG